MLGYLIAGPPSIEPEFETETGLSMEGGEKKVAVVCYAPKNLLIEFPKIDDEVASQVAYRLGENKIAIIRPEYIRAWVDEHPDWELAEEIGKEFKADYVVQIELAAFSLYEGDSTTLYRGRTEAYVKVMRDGGRQADGRAGLHEGHRLHLPERRSPFVLRHDADAVQAGVHLAAQREDRLAVLRTFQRRHDPLGDVSRAENSETSTGRDSRGAAACVFSESEVEAPRFTRPASFSSASCGPEARSNRPPFSARASEP